jgi:hypothetical protein
MVIGNIIEVLDRQVRALDALSYYKLGTNPLMQTLIIHVLCNDNIFIGRVDEHFIITNGLGD